MAVDGGVCVNEPVPLCKALELSVPVVDDVDETLAVCDSVALAVRLAVSVSEPVPL